MARKFNANITLNYLTSSVIQDVQNNHVNIKKQLIINIMQYKNSVLLAEMTYKVANKCTVYMQQA